MQKAITKYAVRRAMDTAQEQALRRADDRVARRTDGVEVVDPAIAAGGGTKRKWWQRKKEPEIKLTPFETSVLKKVKKRAHLLDRGFRICCCNIGLDPLIGIIPVFGDIVAALLALDLVLECARVDLPRSILVLMLLNVAIDFGLGLVPILGDIADYFYKCNTRNAVLLEEFLITRHRDHILMEQGKLPQHHVPGTGSVPGTNEKPAAHPGPARVTVDDDGRQTGITELDDDDEEEMIQMNGAGPANGMSAGPSVNATGPSVNAAGPSVNAAGPSVNAAGPSVNAAGPSVNAAGPSVNAAGPPVNATGPSVSATGPSGPPGNRGGPAQPPPAVVGNEKKKGWW